MAKERQNSTDSDDVENSTATSYDYALIEAGNYRKSDKKFRRFSLLHTVKTCIIAHCRCATKKESKTNHDLPQQVPPFRFQFRFRCRAIPCAVAADVRAMSDVDDCGDAQHRIRDSAD